MFTEEVFRNADIIKTTHSPKILLIYQVFQNYKHLIITIGNK